MKMHVVCCVAGIVYWIMIGASAANGTSTIDPERSWSWGSNIGWVDWHPSEEYGAVIGEFVCSGYLWAPNAGWIHLGDGEPADGIAYSNESGDDYGVNLKERGRLRGLAWSANFGWVVFHDRGDPRVNLVSGELEGMAWIPNAGWVVLGNPNGGEWGVATLAIARGADSDGDGIPDAWKRRYVEDLEALPAGETAPRGDITNREAYVADLNPFDPNDRFEVTRTEAQRRDSGTTVKLEWTGSEDRVYRIWISEDLIEWKRIGPVGIALEEGNRVQLTLPDNLPDRSFFRVEALLPLRYQ
jgi:hypothetical protein